MYGGCRGFESCSRPLDGDKMTRQRCQKKKPCIKCGTTTQNPKYCSVGCQHLYIWEQLKKKALRAGCFPTWKNAKRYLLEKFGRTCSICSLSEWNKKPMPISIDHINGHYDDHRVCNVRLICPNCDAQSDTYKGRNRGNGRHVRRNRYNNGKSY